MRHRCSDTRPNTKVLGLHRNSLTIVESSVIKVGRKLADLDQHSAMAHASLGIDLEQLNRGLCDSGLAMKLRAVPLEVIVPFIDSRIEEPNEFVCVGNVSRRIAPLMAVTQRAGPAHIGQFGRALVLLSADVIRLVRQPRARLRHLTILATVFRSLPNLLSKGGSHHAAEPF